MRPGRLPLRSSAASIGESDASWIFSLVRPQICRLCLSCNFAVRKDPFAGGSQSLEPCAVGARFTAPAHRPRRWTGLPHGDSYHYYLGRLNRVLAEDCLAALECCVDRRFRSDPFVDHIEDREREHMLG